ncbi:signal peptidase complex subunit 2 [Lipomyces arxii]|uniref:signal peptidase complex subunit 2 n=1 Tax=Lipomyces arxii TaxID=56418 RepID=UPI0034CF7681
MSKPKVNLNSIPDLKNATDDEIVKILETKGFKQTFTLIDVRLAIGFLSVFVAAAVGGYDYYVGFEAAKYYTTIGVATYFVLNTILTSWLMFVEKGTFYQGFKSSHKISVKSFTKKYTPVYEIHVSSKFKSIDAKLQFTEYFNTDGEIVNQPLERWLDTLLASLVADSSKKQS